MLEDNQKNIILLDPHELIAHEKVSIRHALSVLLKMIFSGRFKRPILIDSETKTILDGHHRCYSAHRLGLKNVPCYPVDYLADDSIKVDERRPDIEVNKEKVIEMALSPKVFPHKTTKHQYEIPQFDSLSLSDLWK